MKNTWLIALTLGAVFAASPIMAADTLRLGTEGAYAPFNYMDDNGELGGFEIDLGNALCEQMERECEFVVNEWDSIIPNLLAGNYDAIMAGMSITEERKETIAFSDEYKPVDPSLYLAMAGSDLDFENLEGANIGVQGATIQAGFIEEKYGENNTVKAYETSDQALADLAGGNVDVVLADGEVSRTTAEASNGMMEVVGPEELVGGGIAIGLRQTDTELLEAFNQALDALKADGTVDELLKKYFKSESSSEESQETDTAADSAS